MIKNKSFSVWVGGVEVNNYLLTLKDAKLLANYYINNNYIDVLIDNYDDVLIEENF